MILTKEEFLAKWSLEDLQAVADLLNYALELSPPIKVDRKSAAEVYDAIAVDAPLLDQWDIKDLTIRTWEFLSDLGSSHAFQQTLLLRASQEAQKRIEARALRKQVLAKEAARKEAQKKKRLLQKKKGLSKEQDVMQWKRQRGRPRKLKQENKKSRWAALGTILKTMPSSYNKFCILANNLYHEWGGDDNLPQMSMHLRALFSCLHAAGLAKVDAAKDLRYTLKFRRLLENGENANQQIGFFKCNK